MDLRFLPTALTVARLAASPVVAGLILWADEATFTLGASFAGLIFALALGLFALAAITDAADGILARRLSAVTPFGAALDHAADKVLTSCCLVALCVAVFPRDLIAAAIILIARDMTVGGLREGLSLSGRALPVSQTGKLKTTLILIGIGAALLRQSLVLGGATPPTWLTDMDYAIHGVLWFAVVLSLWSAGIYAQAALAPAEKS